MKNQSHRRDLAVITVLALLVIFIVTLGFHFNRKPDGGRRPLSEPSGIIESTGADSSAEAAAKEEITEGINPGQRAPDFTLRDIDGKEVRLSGLRGKPVFLNFFATWCGPCRAEMPDINELSAELKGKVHVVAVAQDDTIPEIKAFAKRLGLNFTVVVDEKGEVGYRYRIQAIPTSLFLNPDGIIVQKQIGMLDKATMKAAIEKASK